MDEYSIVCPFWIDTDGYTDRDRLMFVCGVEFEMLCRLLSNWSGSRPIHRENESRVRMLCGRLGIQCTIEPHQDYDGCETWSELKVPITPLQPE